MNVLQHTRNELNLCLMQNRPDRSYRDTLLRVKGTDDLTITWSGREKDNMNNLEQPGRANVRVKKKIPVKLKEKNNFKLKDKKLNYTW